MYSYLLDFLVGIGGVTFWILYSIASSMHSRVVESAGIHSLCHSSKDHVSVSVFGSVRPRDATRAQGRIFDTISPRSDGGPSVVHLEITMVRLTTAARNVMVSV